jgi:hypothetical protein
MLVISLSLCGVRLNIEIVWLPAMHSTLHDLRTHCRCVTVQILDPGECCSEYNRYVNI